MKRAAAATGQGKGGRLLSGQAYLVRAGLVGLVYFQIVYGAIKDNVNPKDLFSLVNYIAELDVYRNVFYAALPAAVLLLLTPWSAKSNSRAGRVLIALLCLAAGAVCGLLIVISNVSVRPGALQHTALIALSAWYVGINVLLFVLFSLRGDLAVKYGAAVSRMFVLADVLFPGALWPVYRAVNRGPLFRLTKAAPVLAMLLVPLLPWVLVPMEQISTKGSPQLNLDPAVHIMPGVPETYYQVMFLDSGRSLILTRDHDGTIDRFDADLFERIASHIVDDQPRVASMLQDSGDGLLYYVDPKLGRSVLIDPLSLEIRKTIQMRNRVDDVMPNCFWRLLSTPSDGLITAFCPNSLVSIEPSGRSIQASFAADIRHAVFDGAQGRIHLVKSDPGCLLGLDAHTLQLTGQARIPDNAGHIVLDEQARLLYIALPLQGQILVMDADDYRTLEHVRAFPGVRVLLIDRPGDRLFCAGMSPLLEIRRLSDLSLIDRLEIPPWSRWMALDQAGNKLFLTSFSYGLVTVDLNVVAQGSPRRTLLRHDPFYSACTVPTGLVLRLIGLQ
ncbi:MAG: hypothetical protein P9M14_17495 [Candidatus Alcyoniella australis]|nr:hypothetical protein [Candidatus Alcyoniella australis]